MVLRTFKNFLYVECLSFMAAAWMKVQSKFSTWWNLDLERAERSKREQDIETEPTQRHPSLLPSHVSPSLKGVAFHTPVFERQDGFPEQKISPYRPENSPNLD